MKFIFLVLSCMLIFSAMVISQQHLAGITAESSKPVKHDTSQSLLFALSATSDYGGEQAAASNGQNSPVKNSRGKWTGQGTRIEQTYFGKRAAPAIVASFDGLGEGFVGPQGTTTLRNPSDNSLAVGPDHIVQTVNSRMVIFTKKGGRFGETGKVLYGPVETSNVFRGFGGPCTGPDPFGPYYRYEFKRDLFPDYPRPAVWPDGYYTSTSTGDDVIEKHAYVVDRTKMLNGEAATEQSFIIKDVNFLVNADLDGKQLPPPGAPSIMLAAGGSQLKGVYSDDGIYVWKFHVDWQDPSKTKLDGPVKIPVAPYQYLCNGQLTKCVPQPGTDVRLDAQGDKLMARVVYRRIGNRESIVAVHSVATSLGGGGVRWYEFRLDKERNVNLYQQGTYAPDGDYRWMASPAIDSKGNIGIGYSFGGASRFAGQRFAGRLSRDKPGVLTMNEAVLVEGEAAQTSTLRWEDYTQTAIDPSDDQTIWYVGDYLKKNAENYSTRIGAFRLSK